LFLRKMMMFNGEMKLGSHVGEDEFGNNYYENSAYPYPKHRWVEYAGLPWTQNCDPSDVPADWHGWLHNMTDQIPETHDPAEGGKILQHSDAPYTHNEGLHSGIHVPNLTSNKRRGYGIGGFRSSPDERETYWMQAGHPMNERDDVFEESEFESWVPHSDEAVETKKRLRSLDLE
jgi:NADH:ubiquinone oxidoreductase subunit